MLKMESALMLRFFYFSSCFMTFKGENNFTPKDPKTVIVLTEKGPCANGCTEVSDDSFLYGPDPWEDLKGIYVVDEGKNYRYCKTQIHNVGIRCSNNGDRSHPGFFNSKPQVFYAIDSAPCDSPCVARPWLDYQDLKFQCPIVWVAATKEKFQGQTPCSLHLTPYNREWYQISNDGLIIADQSRTENDKNEDTCLLIEKKTRRPIFVGCNPKGKEKANFNIAGEPCLTGVKNQCQYTAASSTYECPNSKGWTTRCLLFLKNHHHWKPKTRKRRGLTINSRQKASSTSANCDNNGDIVVEGNVLVLSTVIANNDAFKCNSKTAEFVTLLAEDRIEIDTSFTFTATPQARLTQFTLVAKEIIITAPTAVSIKLSGGGDFVAIAQVWKNSEKLLVHYGGDYRHCAPYPSFKIEDETLSGAKFEKPFYFVPSFPQILDNYNFELLSDVVDQCDYNCYTFNMYKVLENQEIPRTDNGFVFAYGEGSNGIQYSTDPDPIVCDPKIAYEDTVATMVLNYPDGRWYYRIPDEIREKEKSNRHAFAAPIRQFLFQRTQSNKPWDTSEVLEISEVVSKYMQEYRQNSDKTFYNELEILIVNSHLISNDLEEQLLLSLQYRIGQHPESDQDNNLLVWLYAATSAHLQRVRREANLITNLELYIKPIENIINDYDDANNQDERNRFLNITAREFEEETERQIAVALALINDDVLPQLENIKIKLEEQFDQITIEVEKLIAAANADLKTLEDNLEKAYRARTINAMLSVYKLVATAVTLVAPPIGPAIGTAINVGTSIGETINNKLNAPTLPAGYKIPLSLYNELEPVIDFVEQKRQSLNHRLEELISDLPDDPSLKDLIKFLKEKLVEVQDLEKEGDKRVVITSVKEIEALVKQELIEFGAEPVVENRNFKPRTDEDKKDMMVPGKEKPKLDPETKEALVDAGKKFVSIIGEGVQSYFKSNSQIANYKIQIEQTKKNIAALENFKDKIYDSILPMVLGIFDTFDVATKEMDGAILASIDVTTWNVARSIKDMKFSLNRVLRDFRGGEDIVHSFENMESILDLVGTLYARIAESREKQRYANLAVELSKVGSKYNPKDELASGLKQSMREAISYGLVERVTFAFRMWAFPFARIFLKDIDDITLDLKNKADIKKKSLQRLKLIKEQIQIYKSNVNKEVDHHRKSVIFYVHASQPDQDPFYVWDWSKHKDAIKQLLTGKRTLFNANVLHYQDTGRHHNKEAFQFALIGLNIVIRNPTRPERQTEFNNALKQVYVNMIHMGENYYPFQDKVYTFRTGPTRFELYPGDFSEDSKRFDGQTFSLKKYSEGDATLSPYGPWTFALSLSRSNSSFTSLKLEPDDVVNIELIGTGTLVKNFLDERYMDPTLGDYFEEVDLNNPGLQLRSRTTSRRRCNTTRVHKHFEEDANGETHDMEHLF